MFEQISTPSVLIDLDVAEANIARYQAYCDAHGLALRPHIKTHKVPLLAKKQIAQGAVGITCQKISEAEAMLSEGGISDLLLTYNILGQDKRDALKALASRTRLSVVADNETVVSGLSQTFTSASADLDVLVECDTGAGRCGVQSPEDAAKLALMIDQAPGLTFKGLMTYPPAGQSHAVDQWLQTAKAQIEASNLKVEIVSSGGSPDMWQAHLGTTVTEYRTGTYIYNDRSLVARGVCSFDDCALTILATIVSRPTPRRAIIDAGSKVLTSDLLGLDGFGHILGHDELKIDQLSEEHGRVVSEKPIQLSVGDRVRIVPNHACVVTNMLDEVQLIRGEQFETTSPVVARGRVW